MITRFLVIASLILCSSAARAADLISIYREAVISNPQLAAAASSLDAVRENRPQALAGLRPNIGIIGTVDRSRFKDTDPSNLDQSDPEFKDTTYSTNKLASINLNQPLFRYDRWIELKRSDSEIAAAEARYAAAQQELMIRVSERYFAVLEAQDNLELAKAEKSAIGRQLEQAQQRFEVGLIAITDVKAAQARYDLSTSLVIRTISELQGSKDALLELVGSFHDNVTPLKADLKLTRPEPDSPDTWIARAREQNLSVLAAQAASESARQEMRRQRAGHLPTLDFNASASYLDNKFGGIAPIEREDAEIGLELTIPVYQGGLVSSRTRQARSRFEEATELLQQEVRASEFDTRSAFRGVLTDIAQVEALAASLQSTEVAVEAEEAGFEVGTRTIVDVLNAQREYLLARFNYAQARYKYVVDQLRLKKAAGILSEDDLIEVNRALGATLALDE